MKRDTERRNRLVIAAFVIFAIGIIYVVVNGKKEPAVSVGESVDKVVVRYANVDHELKSEDANAVIELFNGTKVTASEKKDELSDEEYLESYKVTFYEKKNVTDIFYLISGKRAYDPSERKCLSCDKDLLNEVKKYIE